MASIIEALEGNYCLEDESLPEEGGCRGNIQAIQKLVIDTVNQKTGEVLSSITLHDLEKEAQEYTDYGQDMYYI